MVPEIWSATHRIFCHFRPFLPFYTTNDLENQNFEKMKEKPGDITILQICNVNNNLVMYGSWDMERDGHNVLILGHFLPFSSLTIQKSKFWRNENNASRYYHFTLSFCTIFCPFTPLTNRKIQTFEKMRKMSGDIIILHMCTINDKEYKSGPNLAAVQIRQEYKSGHSLIFHLLVTKRMLLRSFFNKMQIRFSKLI